MVLHTTEYTQEYNHSLIQKYNELRKDYIKLKNETEEIYSNGINNDEYKTKLLHFVDDISINKDDKKIFTEYEIDKNKIIQSYLKMLYAFNEDKVSKLFDVRRRILNNRLENINVDNIGTSLNILKEFYNDLHMDIERNKFKSKGKQTYHEDTFSIVMNELSKECTTEYNYENYTIKINNQTRR